MTTTATTSVQSIAITGATGMVGTELREVFDGKTLSISPICFNSITRRSWDQARRNNTTWDTATRELPTDAISAWPCFVTKIESRCLLGELLRKRINGCWSVLDLAEKSDLALTFVFCDSNGNTIFVNV